MVQRLCPPESVLLSNDSESVYEIISKSSLYRNRKVTAYAFSGLGDFTTFLTVSENCLAARLVLAESGTAEEFSIFLSRIEQGTVIELFNQFWNDYKGQENQFLDCADLLLDHIIDYQVLAPIRPDSAMATMLFKNLLLLTRFQELGVKVYI